MPPWGGFLRSSFSKEKCLSHKYDPVHTAGHSLCWMNGKSSCIQHECCSWSGECGREHCPWTKQLSQRGPPCMFPLLPVSTRVQSSHGHSRCHCLTEPTANQGLMVASGKDEFSGGVERTLAHPEGPVSSVCATQRHCFPPGKGPLF